MDQKTKHTPGPWVVLAGRVISTRSGQFYLTYGKDKYGNPLFKDFVELDHNAALIAAAPAMYEALRSIPDHALDCKHSYPHTLACWNCIVKAALAQAEGSAK